MFIPDTNSNKEDENANDKEELRKSWYEEKQEASTKVEINNDRKKDDDDTEAFSIDKIVDHTLKNSRRHRQAKCKHLYWVREYGFEADDVTWEPIK